MSVDRIKGLKEALAAASASHDWGLVRSIEQAIQFYETGKNPYGQPPATPHPRRSKSTST